MTWKAEIEELRAREQLTEKMGGDDKVERQHHYGKLTIRERFAAMADNDTFHEIGKLAGAPEYNEDGELKNSASFAESDMPLLVSLLEEAFNWMRAHPPERASAAA